MADHRRSRGRKLGSSRKIMKRLEVEETKAEDTEEDLYVNEMMEKLHKLFSEDDEIKNIFVTRADMEKVSNITFYNVNDLEQLFDGLNPEGNEYLNYEEFEPGLRKFIQSSPWNQKRKRRSKKRIEFTNFPSLEEADVEEKKQFMSFMEQLGANNIFEDETEIWKLWTRLAHDEPYLLENLEEFLAKVTSQIKEARREKETLEAILQKRISAHTEEVQHLYEEMEQQINAERIKLLNESDARSSIHSKEMKEVLDVKNNEVQQLVGVQDELERELHKLRSTQQVTKTENEKLKRTNQDLEQQLEKIRNQLSEAQSCLSDMQQRIDQNDNEKEKKEAEESTTVLDSQQFYQIFFQDQSLKNKSDAEQITTEPIDEHESAELVLQTSSNIPEISSRTRVISIEEDPMPEYLTGDYKVFEKTTARKPRSFSLVLSRETLFEEEQNIHENYTKTEEHKLDDVQSNDSLEIELMNEMMSKDPISSYSDDHNSSDSTKVTASHISVLLHSPPPMITERFTNTFSLKTNSLRLDDGKAQLHQTQNIVLNSGVKNEKTAVITNSLDKTKLQDGSSKNTSLLFEFESKKDGNQKDAAEQMNSQRDSVKYKAEISKQDSPKINKETHQSLHSFEKKKTFQDISDADHVYKIMVVGNSNVGKTSFLQQVHGGSFPTNISATIGLDYRIKNLIVDNKQYVLQLWDTAGQERFHSITGQFFRKADGIVIMYDVTSKDSFNAACYWLKYIKEKTEEDIVILLIGNKIDCDSARKVAPEEGEKLAQENKLLFTECSAASGINITESLRQLARSLKAHEDFMKNNVKIERSYEKKNKSCCM